MPGIGSLLRSHVVLLIVYSLLISWFFALLLRRGRRPVLRFFAILFLTMVGGVLALAWLMFPFPR